MCYLTKLEGLSRRERFTEARKIYRGLAIYIFIILSIVRSNQSSILSTTFNSINILYSLFLKISKFYNILDLKYL